MRDEDETKETKRKTHIYILSYVDNKKLNCSVRVRIWIWIRIHVDVDVDGHVRVHVRVYLSLNSWIRTCCRQILN